MEIDGMNRVVVNIRVTMPFSRNSILADTYADIATIRTLINVDMIVTTKLLKK